MRSVQSKLLSIILMIMIPILMLINAVALYIQGTAISGILRTQYREAAGEADLLCEDMEAIIEFLKFTAARNTDFGTSDQDMMVKSELSRYLQDATILFRDIDYVCAVSGGVTLVDSRKSDVIGMLTANDLKEHARSEALVKNYSPHWEKLHIGEGDYLHYHMYIGKVMYSVYTSCDMVLARLNDSGNTKYALITSRDGMTGEENGKELQLSQEIPGTSTLIFLGRQKIFESDFRISDDLYLHAETDRKNIVGGIDRSVRIIAVISLLSAFLLPLLYYQIRKWYVLPVQSMTEAFQQFTESGMQYRVQEDARLREFSIMQSQFNRMADELNEGARKYQEEQDRRQRAQLSMLQTKIHPHTFLNSLTTISNLAAMDQKDKLQQYIDLFSTHMRYMLGNGFRKIHLREELWFVDNYIAMQNIRTDQSIFVYKMMEEELLNERIIPFVIYTFVENTIKHAAPQGGWTDIYIHAEKDNGKLRLTIQDNGKGFSDEQLVKLNSMNTEEEDDTRHIGIKNIFRILELVYSSEFSMEFSNTSQGGAAVSIVIPSEDTE